MSGSVNKVILVGNLGKDPEVRHTQNGKKIVNLSVATNETWRDKTSGEKKERVEWHRVVILSTAIAETASTYLKKGAKVYIEGQLQTRKWLDNDGIAEHERSITEIVLNPYRGELVMLNQINGSHIGGDEFKKSYGESPEKNNEYDEEFPF